MKALALFICSLVVSSQALAESEYQGFPKFSYNEKVDLSPVDVDGQLKDALEICKRVRENSIKKMTRWGYQVIDGYECYAQRESQYRYLFTISTEVVYAFDYSQK